MKNKTTTWVLIIILVLIGVWWFTRTPEYVTPPPIVSTPVSADEVKWTFDEKGENAAGLPQTQVTVKIHGETYDAGTYSGICRERNTSELLENQISGVLCYAAGFGDEVGVFKDARDYTLQVGEVQEPSADGPEFRGNFRMITLLK